MIKFDKLNKALKSLGNNAFTIKHAYAEYTKQEFEKYLNSIVFK